MVNPNEQWLDSHEYSTDLLTVLGFEWDGIYPEGSVQPGDDAAEGAAPADESTEDPDELFI